ncbi:MAG TPA: TonB C-terminal domain-containing protein [Myxococcales bacterium]|nr:TonB C-terminal domain-containing protein [Myxococcales bacterium]
MEFLRNNAVGIGAAAVLLCGAAGAIRFIVTNRGGPPPPRRVMQFTLVNLRPPPEPVKPPPPPPQREPEPEPEHATRVNLKPSDFTQPDLSRPAPAPGGGRLALAAEGTPGAGDAFNLAGNPGGKGLLSGGGLGDGEGDGVGDGSGQEARFGWYYARMAGDIEAAFRKLKVLSAASVRVEIRVWADEGGRISRVQLIRSTGDARVDEAIQSVVGTRLSEPPPAGLAMPMIARLIARRPQ